MTFTNSESRALRRSVRGDLVLPADQGYDEARAVWNAMIDRRPAVIVRCAHVDDVPRAIDFARKHGLDISIRGAAHNIAGNAVADGGLVIDFSRMKRVEVDPETRRARVEPGATLGDFDAAAQKHGLATPLGINSTTGVAGLTLGGGFGWLTRRYGMTVDNLLGAEVVTAEGRTLHTSADENADLFWALRGGGGNFGVVTRFDFELHPVGPEVFAGLVVFPFSQAKQVLERYREFIRTAPESLNVWVVLRQAPPLPFLPEAVHGKEVIVLPVFYAGEPAEGQKLASALRAFGDPHGEHLGAMPYVQWQQAFDPLLTAGARNYWKSHNFTELTDGAIDTTIDFAGTLPSPQCEIFIGLISGAANRVPADATAYGHRDAKFVMNVHGRWEAPAQDAAVIDWARSFFDAARPYASRGAYVNFLTAEETDRISEAYGDNYERLARIKARYDPDNVFHINQNIRPAVEPAAVA